MRVCTHIPRHTHTHPYTHAPRHTHTHTSTHTHTPRHTHTHPCTHTRPYTHTSIHTHIHPYTHIHTHTPPCAHTHLSPVLLSSECNPSIRNQSPQCHCHCTFSKAMCSMWDMSKQIKIKGWICKTAIRLIFVSLWMHYCNWSEGKSPFWEMNALPNSYPHKVQHTDGVVISF